MEITQGPRTFAILMSEAEMRYVHHVVGGRTGVQDAGFGQLANEVFSSLDIALNGDEDE